MDQFNTVLRKVYTVEATLGYRLAWVTQTYLRPDKGMTVRAVVENLMAQDPDVLFLGDVNAPESAECAVRAAEQGVFVIATLAAPTLFDALWQFARLTPPPTRVARCVRGVMAQHLVRRVCAACREEDTAPPDALFLYLPALPQGSPSEHRLFRGAGCDACRNTGYKGRIGLFDLLSPTGETLELLGQGASPRVLRDNVSFPERVSFRDDLSEEVAGGVTSVDEGWRALRAIDEM